MLRPTGQKRAQKRSQKRVWPIALLALAAVAALGQAAKPAPAPDPKKPDEPLGTYSLVTTVFEPSTATHLLNPAPTIAVDPGTDRAPVDSSGEKTVPAQYQIEKFGTPWFDCAPTAAPATPQTRPRGCEALDRTVLTIRDPNTIAWRISTHGPAVQLSVNLEVHDILPVSQGTAETPWKARDVIFVAVPKATPALRFSSEVLVGEWNGEAIVFEVGKDLPEPAKKALEDLGVKQDLGDRVLYSFRVKEPEKKSEKKP
jgi:hypothetical protein